MRKYLFFIFLFTFIMICKSQNKNESYFPIIIKYDKFDNYTSISTNCISFENGICMSASWICYGNDTCKPLYINLSITSWSKDWRFLHGQDLIIIADSMRIIPKYQNNYDGHIFNDGDVSESMSYKVSPEIFKIIANSKIVECKLYIEYFNMKFERRNEFRNLINYF